MENLKKKRSISPYILVILSFLIVILVGSFLLTMPWANNYNAWLWNYKTAEGNVITYLDCLVTAVSATCVTGVFTYHQPIGQVLSFGGQVVLLSLIQIGGLGFITILTFVITLFNSRLKFKNRLFIAQMVNSTNFADVVKFVRKLILITFICEGVGFLLSLPVFLNLYKDNILMALWNSLFHSISAFNNAGFDIFHGNSLIGGITGSNGVTITGPLYYYFSIITMILIIVGGISFMVLIEIFSGKKKPSQWGILTKIVLASTAFLILFGTIALIITDCFKGEGSMTVFDALFQSVTCRTAGFATYAQDSISPAGKMISCLLMFIGGSPISTAGGIKTTTIFMVVLAILSYFSNGRVKAFHRTYSSNMVVKAMSLMTIALFVLLLGYIGLISFGLQPGIKYADTGLTTDSSSIFAYLVFSCFGTVGLCSGIEPYLSIGGKFVICLLMFLGRIGPITFFQIVQENFNKESTGAYKCVEEDFLLG
jgi:trk system potassium uptake protein TrkH